MKLSERKKKILQIVVDDYITSAQPVSSKSITEKHMKDVSSATVRSELAQLEELGYLSHIHTSSGRVPSIEAYKLYVAELMDKSKLTSKEIGHIKSALSKQVNNMESVIKNTVKVISELTDYTSVAISGHDENDVIEKVNIFRIKSTSALLLIVTENTLIKDKYISVPEEMTDEQIDSASVLINDKFKGRKISEILKISYEVEEQFDIYKDIFLSVISAIENYVNNKETDVVMEGQDKILNHPEYADVDKVKNFLSVVSDKDRIANLLTKEDSIEISIKIGGKDGDEEIPEDCSLVTATYSSGDTKLGTYGVIGPLRMDYQKVISVLESVGRVLEEVIKNKN